MRQHIYISLFMDTVRPVSVLIPRSPLSEEPGGSDGAGHNKDPRVVGRRVDGEQEKAGTLRVVPGRRPHDHFAVLAGDLDQPALRPIPGGQLLSFHMLRVSREIPDEEDRLEVIEVHLDDLFGAGPSVAVDVKNRLVGEKVLRGPLQGSPVAIPGNDF